jgi:hypothetical protein
MVALSTVLKIAAPGRVSIPANGSRMGALCITTEPPNLPIVNNLGSTILNPGT